MNLRNLHRHVKNHDWFAVCVDFLIDAFQGTQIEVRRRLANHYKNVAAIAAVQTPELKLDLVRRLVDLDTKLKNYQRLVDRGEALDRILAETQP